MLMNMCGVVGSKPFRKYLEVDTTGQFWIWANGDNLSRRILSFVNYWELPPTAHFQQYVALYLIVKSVQTSKRCTSRCLSHNPLHPWFRDKRHQGWGQEPKSPLHHSTSTTGAGAGGGGGGSGGGPGTPGFTFPPTPPTDAATEAPQEYNLGGHAVGMFLHPTDPGTGPGSCDVKPMLGGQQKPREGHGYQSYQDYHYNSYHQLMFGGDKGSCTSPGQKGDPGQASTSQSNRSPMIWMKSETGLATEEIPIYVE
ncbi:hypothetical protein O3M35_009987 [Rhynocoris fuscipes]|uniref:Uncharacterized protein n=1 Tax=Rhynocoris fuscipes TaxID=488301 RepID=A0AAW1CYQ6_9HEMI